MYDHEIRLIRTYLAGAEDDWALMGGILRYGWIAGGAIRSAFAREPIKDIDVFFSTDLDRTCLEQDLIATGFLGVFDTGNASTFRKGKVCIQTVKKLYPNPDECIRSFDFTACQAYLTQPSERLKPEITLGPTFLKDLAARELVLVRPDGLAKTPYPLNTVLRAMKYQQRGYRIRPVEMVQLLIQCAKLNLTTLKDWKEHLLGIDMILLSALFDKMEKESENGVEAKVDAELLMSAIDQYVDDLREEEVK